MTEFNSESEQERIASLKSFQILDTLPEKEFDELTLLASQICETPIAAISLIDENRQWFKSSIGFPGKETSRDLSFCQHTIKSDDLLVVPDTTKDELFAENPAVKNAPKIRFYAGAPLRTSDGQRLGTLCVTDLRPRELSEEQKSALNALSNSVISLLESRRELVNLKNEMTETTVFPSDENFSESDDKLKNVLGKSARNNSSVFHRHVKHYLIATIIIAVVTAVKSMLASTLQVEAPFLLFVSAVLLAAWRGGLGPGIYATFLTACIIDFFLLPPAGKIFDREYGQNVQLLIFIAQGLFVTLLCASRLRSENLLNYARNQLENRVAKRTNQLAQANKVLHKEIQERGVLQKDLQKARDAALEAARLKSDFLANMSHEIRTPMNGVIGVTGLLLETKLDGEQQRYAEIIRNSGESLLTVINDILDFSKVEAGKLELEVMDFNLQNTIESTVELLTSKARAQNNELATLIYNDVPLNLRGDAGRIQQILTNLIGNAVKFTKDGDIVVRVKKVEETVGQIELKFSVADTGEGISKEVQEKLFQPFTQSDASMSRRFGGTGLGLSISKKLIEMMNGEIGVESELGKGSTFWFSILLKKQHSSNPSNTAGVKFPVAHAALAEQRVLVVDDNMVNREVLVYQVRSWGMETDEATNGFEAIGMIKTASSIGKPFDLIVLDLHMPGINGVETARRITSEIKGKPPAMILLSSSTNKTDAKTLRKVGFSVSLNKPYRQSDLLDAVYETLGLNRRTKNPVFSVHTTTAPDAEDDHKIETKITDAAAQTGKPKRILLVEDNQVNQMVAQTLLKKFGYQADIAANGLEAIKALEMLPYDLILMDCQMPEMDGYEATRTIRARDWEIAKIPIIALTAHAIEGEREKCLNAGMNDYISKPVQKNALRAILEQWLNFAEEAETKTVTDYQGDEAAPTNYDAEIIVLETPEKPAETSTETAAAAAMDIATLDEITDNDLQMRREVLEMYLAQTTDQLNEIERAIIVKDAAALSSIAHKAVGGSALCGMTAIVEPFRKLERAGLDGKIEEAATFLVQARWAFASINKQCLEMLAE